MLFIKSLYGNDLMNSQILCSKIGAAKMKKRNICEKMYY